MCALTEGLIQYLGASKLDVRRGRGFVSHHGRVPEQWRQGARSRTTYNNKLNDTDVCKVIFTRNISE